MFEWEGLKGYCDRGDYFRGLNLMKVHINKFMKKEFKKWEYMEEIKECVIGVEKVLKKGYYVMIV